MQRNFALSLQMLVKKYASEIPNAKHKHSHDMRNTNKNNMFMTPTDPNEIGKYID